jgi:DNA end-binding protein Ku
MHLAEVIGISDGLTGYGHHMAPRSIWNGTLAFGLVRVPVKLYSAIQEKTIRFREVHISDGSPLAHHRICEAEDESVSYDEIVKGYEVTEGEYVILDRDEIKAAAGDRGRLLELDQFVSAAEIDPVFYERTYYLGPREDDESFELLLRALGRCGLAGIGRFSMRGREYLAAVRSSGDALLLHTLKFHDEVLGAEDLEIPAPTAEPTDRELEMAKSLIDGLTAEFDPDEYTDQYREAVMDLISAKVDGHDPEPVAKTPDERPDDLEAALRASLERRKSEA